MNRINIVLVGAFLGIALFISACKEVEDPTPDPSSTSSRIKSVQIVETGELMEFSYDQAGMLTTVVNSYFGEQDKMHLTYANGSVASLTYDYDGDLYPYDVNYAGNQMTISDGEDELRFQINGNDIEAFEWYYSFGGPLEKDMEWRMDYQNGNATGIHVMNFYEGQATDTTDVYLDYLSTASPFYFSPSVRAALMASLGEGILMVYLLSQHNIDGMQDSDGISYAFQYTYNSDGLPTRIAMTSSFFDMTVNITYDK